MSYCDDEDQDQEEWRIFGVGMQIIPNTGQKRCIFKAQTIHDVLISEQHLHLPAECQGVHRENNNHEEAIFWVGAL